MAYYRLSVLFTALVLGACTPLAPVVKTEGQQVNVGVAQKCLKKDDIPPKPQFPLDQVDLSNDKEALARLVNAARLERKVRTEYVDKVDKVLNKCAD